jgi:putative SOS response-associated peptidase YedK
MAEEVLALCGRYSATKDPAKLAAEFDAMDATDGSGPAPDHNVAPTKAVFTVVQRHPRDDDGEPDGETTVRSIRVMRWGLVPAWAKDPKIGSRMINARAETAGSKPAFRTALARRRCLIPADGWYEWAGPDKQPFFMTGTAGSSLALAGIWSTWRAESPGADDADTADRAASPLVSCAVLTTDAVGQLTDVHHRMPLLLPRTAWTRWLDPDASDVAELLAPPVAELVESLELRPVSRAVNKVRNNGPQLTERVDLALEPAPELFDST